MVPLSYSQLCHRKTVSVKRKMETQFGLQRVKEENAKILKDFSNSTTQAATLTARNVANHYQYGKDNLAETFKKVLKNLDNVLQEGLFNKSFTNQTGTSSGT
jgi:hypothetical protein